MQLETVSIHRWGSFVVCAMEQHPPGLMEYVWKR
jgi:hypothetical protein